MIKGALVLILIYILHKYIVAWIMYHYSTDERFGNSIWRWTYDYPVKGLKDISDLDDKIFVRKRRIRNRTVSIMYWNFFIGFTVLMYFLSDLLIYILN